MSNDGPQLHVGTVGGGFYIGLNGRATQRVCPTADRLVADYLAGQPADPCITLDLTDCLWVDSTFAGWLIGVHKRLQRVAGARLLLAGCSDRCRGSFDKMRIAALFEFVAAEPPADVTEVTCSGSDRPDKATLQLMASAHEELASVDETNQRVFTPVATLLRHQIEQGKT